MRVGWIQTRPVYGDPAGNLRRLEAILASQDADLWVLPELFSTGYLFASREELAGLAESLSDGETVGSLIDLASRRSCAFVAGIAERAPDGRLYNSAVALDGSGVRTVYRKIHLFDHETKWFDPGDRPCPVTSLAGVRIGIMICFDWRFPEAARTLALSGAQVIAHPSNLVHAHCQSAMVTRALENRVFTVTANRVGIEERGGLRAAFTGGSRIVSPDGEILNHGPEADESCAAVEIDPARADEKHVTPRNHILRDRRPAFYRLGPTDA